MTRTAMKILGQCRAACLREGRLASPLPPAARDGYAALSAWIEQGMPIERIVLEDVRLVPPTLDLARDRLASPACGYILPTRRDWIVLARRAAQEPVRLSPRAAWAYPQPMLVYCGWRGERRVIVSGAVNLADDPTPATMRLAAGKCYGELGAADLTDDEAQDDLLMLAIPLARFYR